MEVYSFLITTGGWQMDSILQNPYNDSTFVKIG